MSDDSKAPAIRVLMAQEAPEGERFQPGTEAGWLDQVVMVNHGRFKGRPGVVVAADIAETGPGVAVFLEVEVKEASQ